jgi:hypothetical protein
LSYLQGPYPHPHLQVPYLHPHPQRLVLKRNINCSPFIIKEFSYKYISIISSLYVLFTRWDVNVRKNTLKLIKRVKVCYLLCGNVHPRVSNNVAYFINYSWLKRLIKLKIFLQVKRSLTFYSLLTVLHQAWYEKKTDCRQNLSTNSTVPGQK